MFKFILQRIERPTPSGKKYLSEIDGLRFVAILLVILQHLSERLIRNFPLPFAVPVKQDAFAFLVSRGTIGVFLFFAISGFVLALPFANSANKIRLKDFYLRRLTRIEPPYIIWLLIFSSVLIFKGTYSLSEITPHFLTSATYTHWFFYQEYSIVNPVAWSLEIEIQFYIVAPFIAKAYFSIQNLLKRRLILMVFIICYIFIMHYFGWLHFPMKATLLGRLPNFLIGFLALDFYLFNTSVAFKLPKIIWDVVAPTLIIILCYTWTEELWKTIIFNIALLFLFISVFKSGYINKLIKNPWIAAFGGMCYTIYLMHLPLLEGIFKITSRIVLTHYYAINLLLQAIIALPIIGLCGILFYWGFEKPFMKMGWWKSIKLVSTISRHLSVISFSRRSVSNQQSSISYQPSRELTNEKNS